MLFYLHAAIMLLFGAFLSGLGLILIVGFVGAAYGIANEFKWGYNLGIALSVLALLPFAYLVWVDGIGELLRIPVLMGLMIPVARFALLVHPESQEYRRIWFS